MTNQEIKDTLDSIAMKFTEAIDSLSDARNSLGTIYFSEDMHDAEDQVKRTLEEYENLLVRLNDHQRGVVVRAIGLMIFELQTQLKMITDSVRDNP